MLKDHHLALPAIAGHTHMIERDPDTAALHWSRLTATVDLALDWAQDGAPPAVDTTVGGTPEQWDELKPLMIERVGELVRYGEQRGVVIAIEPHVGSMLDTPARVLELLDAIHSPFLKLNFDISHFNVMGIPIAESVGALAAHTVHTHVKDERGVVPNYQFLIPGEGEFDYVAYLRAMRSMATPASSPPRSASWCSAALATIRWPPPSRPTERSRAPLSRRGLGGWLDQGVTLGYRSSESSFERTSIGRNLCRSWRTVNELSPFLGFWR